MARAETTATKLIYAINLSLSICVVLSVITIWDFFLHLLLFQSRKGNWKSSFSRSSFYTSASIFQVHLHWQRETAFPKRNERNINNRSDGGSEKTLKIGTWMACAFSEKEKFSQSFCNFGEASAFMCK